MTHLGGITMTPQQNLMRQLIYPSVVGSILVWFIQSMWETVQYGLPGQSASHWISVFMTLSLLSYLHLAFLIHQRPFGDDYTGLIFACDLIDIVAIYAIFWAIDLVSPATFGKHGTSYQLSYAGLAVISFSLCVKAGVAMTHRKKLLSKDRGKWADTVLGASAVALLLSFCFRDNSPDGIVITYGALTIYVAVVLANYAYKTWKLGVGNV
jgi:hypothetical protein